MCHEDKKNDFPGRVEGGIRLVTDYTNRRKTLCKGQGHEPSWDLQQKCNKFSEEGREFDKRWLGGTTGI